MKIGVTGTRNNITAKQKMLLHVFLKTMPADTEVHHGDCVGADVTVAEMAASLGFKTICHPPIKTDLRAFHQSTETLNPLSYFARNRNIVDETELLLVVPMQNSWSPKGGTWYTHDYALKKRKPVKIFWPIHQEER